MSHLATSSPAISFFLFPFSLQHSALAPAAFTAAANHTFPLHSIFAGFFSLQLLVTACFHHQLHRSEQRRSSSRSGAQTPRSTFREPGRQCGSEQAYAISTLFRPCVPASLSGVCVPRGSCRLTGKYLNDLNAVRAQYAHNASPIA